MSEQQIKMARLTYSPADPLIHPINRPTKATIAVALYGASEHVSVPIFMQSGNNVHRYMLIKVQMVNEATNKIQRHLQPMWLLMNAETKPSVGKNDTFYVGNQNIGMLQDFEGSMVDENGEMKTPKYNFAIVTGNMIPFNAAPNKLFGKEWFTKIRPNFCNAQNEKLIGIEKDGIMQRLMPNTPEYDAFMQAGCVVTEKMFRGMLTSGMIEKNHVFYVDDDRFSPITAPYYNAASASALYDAAKTGVRHPVFVNSASGVICIDTSINHTTTGNNKTVLDHGLRTLFPGQSNAKYMFDRVGTTYDRRKQVVPARLSAIDPLTISYLNGSKATSEDDEEATDVTINGRSSRAARLEDIVQKETRFIHFSDCNLRIHSAADSDVSMKIAIEYVMTPASTYSTLNDASRMNQVAVVSEVDFNSLFTDDTGVSDEKVAQLLAEMDKAETKKKAPEPEKEKKPADTVTSTGDEFGSDLPF